MASTAFMIFAGISRSTLFVRPNIIRLDIALSILLLKGQGSDTINGINCDPLYQSDNRKFLVMQPSFRAVGQTHAKW